MDQKNLGSFIWSVAELLRGDFKQSEYGLVILPFTVLRRFECVLEPTRDAVLKKHAEISGMNIALDLVLPGVSGQQFYNTSRYQLNNLGVADTLANLEDYLNKFSANARNVFEQFEFSNKLMRLEEDKLLYKVAQHFSSINLHPDTVSNHEMGLAFEHLIRTFAESARGDKGRFGPGLPRVSDGSLLFLMHLISRMKTDGQSRIGIVLNGSPLFTGGAGSGESEIRRWVLENDWLEAIIAMPTDMFYNTGIATYIWVLSNRKDGQRREKVQLIDASGEDFWRSMRKSLGSKRRYLPEQSIAEIARLYAAFEESEQSKIFDMTDFGYRRITVERPLQLSFYPKDIKRRAALCEDKAWARWKPERQTEILAALTHCPEKISNREALLAELPKLKATELNLLQKHLGEHDEEAAYCRNNKG